MYERTIMLIAHVTDLHMLEARPEARRGFDRLRLRLLCNGRPMSSLDRLRRVLGVLGKVREAKPDHICITGDLTEDGSESQFEALAEALAQARLEPERVTLVPGNHDAYTRPDGFARALEGPLAAFRYTSTPGSILERAGQIILPVSTMISQSFIRAAGYVGDEARAKLRRGLEHARARRSAALVAMHHPPVVARRGPIDWFDNLLDMRAVREVLSGFGPSYVLHGHLHRKTELPMGLAMALGARAVADHPSPVRLYEAQGMHLLERGENA